MCKCIFYLASLYFIVNVDKRNYNGHARALKSTTIATMHVKIDYGDIMHPYSFLSAFVSPLFVRSIGEPVSINAFSDTLFTYDRGILDFFVMLNTHPPTRYCSQSTSLTCVVSVALSSSLVSNWSFGFDDQ